MFTDMYTGSLFFLQLLALQVTAEDGPPLSGFDSPANPTPPFVAFAPPSTSVTQINVDVAFQEKFVFNPSNINASIGSKVTFYFPPGLTHSVTQSSFASPCTYLAASGNSSAGFDSGLTSASTFTINITDTQPIWFHCKQATHCSSGMVGSINSLTTGDTFASFLAAAMALGSNASVETSRHYASRGGPEPSSDVSYLYLAPSNSNDHRFKPGVLAAITFGPLMPLYALVAFCAFRYRKRVGNSGRLEARLSIAGPTPLRETGGSEPIQNGAASSNSSDVPLRIIRPSKARVRIHKDTGGDFVRLDSVDPVDTLPIHAKAVPRQMTCVLPHQSLTGLEGHPRPE